MKFFPFSTPLTGPVPQTVQFTDQSTNSPIAWSWDFGDGGTSREQNPVHTYETAGTYDVTLTVWNDLGSDTIEQQYSTAGTS